MLLPLYEPALKVASQTSWPDGRRGLFHGFDELWRD